MQYPHPSTFHSAFNDENLSVIAAKMLDVRYMTVRQLDTEYDDNYTRECPIYGRTRRMLLSLHRSKKYPWLEVTSLGMGVTIYIGNKATKFFRDDLENPEKAGFFKQETFECLFEEDDSVPVLWRFVIERALTDEDEDQVYFVGYNKFNDKISMWQYQAGAAPLYSLDQTVPEAANMEPAEIHITEESDSKHSNEDTIDADADLKREDQMVELVTQNK